MRFRPTAGLSRLPTLARRRLSTVAQLPEVVSEAAFSTRLDAALVVGPPADTDLDILESQPASRRYLVLYA